MKNDLSIKNGFAIPGSEIEITTSRAGGPGGQHVNRTSTRNFCWNVKNTMALNTEQKEIILKNLKNQLTIDRDLIIHSSISCSQEQKK